MRSFAVPCTRYKPCRRFAQRLGLAVLGAMPLAGCGGGSGSVNSALTTPVTAPTTTNSTSGTTNDRISAFVSKPTVQAGQSVRLTAALSSTSGNALVGKSVLFSLGDTSVGNATTDANGQAFLDYPLPRSQASQTYAVKASFEGDSALTACQGYASLNVTTATPATALSLTLDKPSAFIGQNVTLTADLTEGGPQAGKTIAFALGGAPIGTAQTGPTGKATLTYVIAAGTPLGGTPLTAAFAGDAGLAPSSASAPFAVQKGTGLTVTPNSVTTTGPTTTFNIKAVLLDTDGTPLAGKKVIVALPISLLPRPLYVNGAATTDATGTASLVVTASYPTMGGGDPNGGDPPHPVPPPHGSWAIPVHFDGDASYAATSATLTVIVP